MGPVSRDTCDSSWLVKTSASLCDTGVIVAPIAGAAEGGGWGLIKGVGVGIAGLVVLPIAGAVGAVRDVGMWRSMRTYKARAITPAFHAQEWTGRTSLHNDSLSGSSSSTKCKA